MSIKYERIIYWSDEDNAFIVEVPELPGCLADGQTYQKAVANAEAIIQEWIDTAEDLGRSVPKPARHYHNNEVSDEIQDSFEENRGRI